jgi:hypothetical protein
VPTCGANPAGVSFTASSSYPTWTSTYYNVGGTGCP